MGIDQSVKDLLQDALALIEPRSKDFIDSHSGCIVRGNAAARDWVERARIVLDISAKDRAELSSEFGIQT